MTTPADTQAAMRQLLEQLCEEQGLTPREAMATLLEADDYADDSGVVDLPDSGEGEVVYLGPRVRNMVSAEIPEHMIPTLERLMVYFEEACREQGVTPAEVLTFRSGLCRYRISKFWRDGDPSMAPLRQMQNSAKAMVKAKIRPDGDPWVELGITGYVQYEEDDISKRPEIFQFHQDIKDHLHDGKVVVVEAADRLVRSVSLGSSMLNRMIDRDIDIFEFAYDEQVEPLEKRWSHYIDDLKEAEIEIKRLRDRIKRDRNARINNHMLAGGAGTFAHLRKLVRGKKNRIRVADLPPNPDYAWIAVEMFERVAHDHENPTAIGTDLQGRAERGEIPYPPHRLGKDGERLVPMWRVSHVVNLIRTASSKGCQFNDRDEAIACPIIHPLVSDELWQLANDELDRQQTAKEGKGNWGKRPRMGPLRRKPGLPLLRCDGCGAPGKSSSHHTVRCSKPTLVGRARPNADPKAGTDTEGHRGFQLPDAIYIPMICEVALGMLESVPEIAAEANARQVEVDRTAEDLGKERKTLASLNDRARRIRIAFIDDDAKDDAEPTKDQAEFTAQIAANQVNIDACQERIAKLQKQPKAPKGQLREGETYRSRWAVEEAKPNLEGSIWINDRLAELFKEIRVKVGPDYIGARNTFHEGRLIFVPAEGVTVSEGFVAEIAQRLYEHRLTTIRATGTGRPEQFISDEAFRIHYDERFGTTTVMRRLNALAVADPKWKTPKPNTEVRLAKWTGFWTIMQTDKLVREEYARRGIPFAPNTKLHVSDDDRRLMREMIAEHGDAYTLNLFNVTLGKRREGGQLWDVRAMHRAIKVSGSFGGRKPTLTEDLLDLAESMQNHGKSLREIRLALAVLPTPCITSEPNLSRRLCARRRARASASV